MLIRSKHSFDCPWFSVYKHLPWLSLFSTNNAVLPSTFYAWGNVSADCLADSTCCLKMAYQTICQYCFAIQYSRLCFSRRHLNTCCSSLDIFASQCFFPSRPYSWHLQGPTQHFGSTLNFLWNQARCNQSLPSFWPTEKLWLACLASSIPLISIKNRCVLCSYSKAWSRLPFVGAECS